MRLIAVLLVLASLFGLAWAWQAGTLDALRRESRAAAGDSGGRRDPEFAPLPEGWGVVVIGKPSGAAPVPGSVDRAAPALPADASSVPEASDADWVALEERALGDFRVEVFAGQTLFSITQMHYGSANQELCAALARYNGIHDPAALEVGETLLLPPVERLFRHRRQGE